MSDGNEKKDGDGIYEDSEPEEELTEEQLEKELREKKRNQVNGQIGA